MKLWKSKEYKFINGTKGVISLFLCVLLTPVLTIASSLIELSRYQSATQMIDEILDCAALSTLANYDEYIQERFGLFSISQDCNIKKEMKNNLSKNAALLDGNVTLTNTFTAKGTFPLSNTNVLQSQMNDFAETTVLTELFLDDLNIEDLIKKLDGLKGLSNLASMASNVADIATKVEALVNSAQALVDSIQSLQDQITSAKSSIETAFNSIADLYKKMNDDAFTINFDDEESLKTFFNDYYDALKKVYDNTNNAINSVSGIVTKVDAIPGKITAFSTALDEASKALEKMKKTTDNIDDSTSTAEKDSTVSESSEESNDIYEVLIEEFENIEEDVVNSLKSGALDAIKSAANSFKSDISSGLGLDVTKRWNLKEYYSVPLSAEAKEDITKLLETLPDVWNEGSYSKLVDELKKQFIPSAFDKSFGNIKSIISEAIAGAKKTFEEKAKESMSGVLTSLVDALNALFDLDVFYDGKLNAYLSKSTQKTLLSDPSGDNPYITLLNAISDLTQAVTTFANGLAKFNFFEIIDAVKKLGSGLKNLVSSLIDVTNKTIAKISELGKYVTTGDLGSLYELLLTSGYVVHNMPNRTMVSYGGTQVTSSGIVSTNALSGSALTGFKYADIKTPTSAGATPAALSGITGLVKFLKDSNKGSGSDAMFKGAEAEYVLVGSPSELMNQVISFMQIYVLRLLLNIAPVFTDGAVGTMAAAATIASWAVYLLVLVAEPLVDTIFLVNGAESYLYKKSCYLTPVGIPTMISTLSQIAIKNKALKGAADKELNKLKTSLSGKTNGMSFKKGFGSMDYDTHLLLLLMMTVTKKDMLTRVANIIQLETAYYHNQTGTGVNFKIKKSYTTIEATTEIQLNSFISVFASNPDGMKIKFNRTKGY